MPVTPESSFYNDWHQFLDSFFAELTLNPKFGPESSQKVKSIFFRFDSAIAQSNVDLNWPDLVVLTSRARNMLIR